MKKKFLALLLAAFMVVSLLPTVAFAEAQKIGSSDVTWELSNDNTVLTLGGTGAMPDFTNKSDIPWFSAQDKITTVKVGSGITRIGTLAFSDCDIANLYIEDLESWCKIEFASASSNPFRGEDQNNNLYVNGNLTTDLVIPDTITEIKDNAFINFTNLTSVTIPSSVTSIGDGAFGYCDGLKSVTIPSSVTSIGDRAFAMCADLTNVTISSGVKSIGNYAFENCPKLTSVTIPSSVTSIGMFAFSTSDPDDVGCVSLTSVTVKATTPPALGSSSAFPTSNDGFKVYVPSGTLTDYNNAAKWEFISCLAEAYMVDVAATTYGAVTVNKDYFPTDTYKTANDTVNVTVNPAAGYKLKSLKWYTSDPASATDITDTKSFTMPLANVTVTAEFDKIVTVSTEADLRTAIENADGARTIKLNNDITLTAAIDITSGKSITLNLNGHVLNRGLTSSTGAITVTTHGSVIYVSSGAVLTLTDGNPDAVHYYEYSTGSAWTWNDNNTSGAIEISAINNSTAPGTPIRVSGGAITGGTGTLGEGYDNFANGGGVYVKGEFYMSGGNIVGNCADRVGVDAIGGGVMVGYEASFTISGGNIAGNTANKGCGVENRGNFIMTGGVITNNTTNKANDGGSGGGGVDNSGDFTMTGGTITNNTDIGKGGGGGVKNSGDFTMIGGTISGNKSATAGGGVKIDEGKFTMTGGTISGNEADWGGAVYNLSNFVMENGTISGNTATNGDALGGGGVYNEKYFIMTGGAITGNTTKGNGGGVSHETGTFTLGGTAQITGNVTGGAITDNNDGTYSLSGGAVNNVYVWNGKEITLGEGDNKPKDTMCIGVTTAEAPTESTPVQFTNNGSSNDAKYFFADKSTYYVDFDNNYLVLKLIPQSTITFDANEGTCASGSAITNAEGKLAVLPTATRDGYTFNGWYTTTSGGIKVTTSTVFTSDTTIYAQWTEILTPPAPSYGGGSSSSTVTVPVTGDENTVKVSATVSGSTATVKKINKADLEKVTEGESVSIDLSAAGKNVDTAKIPTETVEKIAEKSSMTVKLPAATVEFDKAATEEIADQAKGSNIELVVDDVKEVSLNAVQKEAVRKLDTAIIIDAYLESNGSKLCTSDNGGFGGGSAKVILPYEIKNNRKPENYSVFYVNEAGKLEKLNAKYDKELKAFVFEIEHFSVYAVAFEQFVDIDVNAYYYDAVKWAASNGITDGTDDTHFSPNGITNRAQMVTFLWRAAGKPEPTLTECPFTDVEAGSYYYKAVLWAYENGITDGTTATTFEPDKNVSRAQTVTFLWRYAGKPVLDYWMQMTDVASGQYYTEAVRWALAEGITEGTSKTTFSPNDDCLRGQIVTFLYRSLVK